MATTNPVKFYAVKEMPTENVNANGIYFVAGTDGMPGRIYKGDKLFGAAQVTTYDYKKDASDQYTNVIDFPTGKSPVRGDVNISIKNGAEIYDGSEWLSLGVSDEQIVEIVKENINATFDGLLGYDTIKLTNDEKAALDEREDGFYESDAEDAKKVADKDGNKIGEDGKPEKESFVTVDKVNAGTVTADAINIKEDEDSDPTPLADYIAAKIDEIEEHSESSTEDDDAPFKVTVTTEKGSVSGVEFVAPELVDDISTANVDKESEGYKDTLATTAAIKEYVDGKFTNIDTPMDFVGAVSEFPENPNNGDVIVFTTPEEGKEVYIKDGVVVEAGTEGAVEVKPGQEYIYVKPEGSETGKWEQIGDQNALASLAGDVNDINELLGTDTLKTSSDAIDGAETITEAINNIADAVDTLNGDADIEGSVDNKVQSAIDALTGEDGVSGSDTVDGETEATATVTIKAGEDGALAPEIDINEATKIRDAKPVVAEGEEAPEAPVEGYADNAHLATELAVRQAIIDAMQSMEMVWLDENGNEINS